MMAWGPNKRVYQWRSLVDKWACERKLSQALILAVIQMESGGNETAYRYEPGYFRKYLKNSPAWKTIMAERGLKPGDVSASYGLMQIMFPTAVGIMPEIRMPRDLFDPDRNVSCGTLYLSRLLAKYSGNVREVLAHYNGGRGGVLALRAGRDTPATAYARIVDELRERYVDYHKSKGE